VRDCTIRLNGTNGIVVSGGSQVIGNTLDRNVGDGIFTGGDASRIEANTATYNQGFGLDLLGGINVIVRNSARGNGAGGVDNNYQGVNNSKFNVYGRIIDMSTPGLIPDNFGAWSNISY
jgi:hypothetical protein